MVPQKSIISFIAESKQIFSEGVWVFVGEIASTIGLLVGIRLLTEYVSPTVFGKISLLMGVIALFYGTFCQPIFMALLRFYPDFAGEGKVANLRRAIGSKLFYITSVLMLCIFFGGGVYSYSFNGSFLAVIALAGIFSLEVIKGVEGSFLSAARRQRPFAILKAAEAWCRPLAAVLLVMIISSKTSTVLIGYFLASSIVLFIFNVTVNREGVEKKHKIWEKTPILEKNLRKYTIPLIPLALIGWISGLGDRYIIGGLLGFEKVGIYAAAYGLISRPFLLCGTVIEQTLRPVYFEAITESNKVREEKIFKTWFFMTALFCIAGVTCVYFFKNIIASILLAEKYRASTVLMPWIAIGYVFLVLSYVFEKPLYGYGNTRFVAHIQIVGAIFSIAVGIPLIFMYGLNGAAYSVAIYFFLQFIVSILVYMRNKKEIKSRYVVDKFSDENIA